MANITKLLPGVEYYKCPWCGFIEHRLLIDVARFNFPCPRCGKHKLNEFIPDNSLIHDTTTMDNCDV